MADKITVELSEPAAVFLRAAVAHLNQRKILPDDDAEALRTSAWLEEIEASVAMGLSYRAATGRGGGANGSD